MESLVAWRGGLRGWARGRVAAWRLRRAVRSGGPLRLVVGSGGIAESGWLATDMESLDLLSTREWRNFFPPDAITAILAEHVWEHLTPADGLVAARNCFAHLRPGGALRIAVPDGFHPDPGYRERVRPGGTGDGAHDHKVLYDHATLTALLTAAGLEVELLEYFDATGAFHAVDWNPAEGLVRRSRRFDPRNRDGELRYTSLIADARRPGRSQLQSPSTLSGR